MKLEIKPYKSICGLEIFKINGINAGKCDFGDMEDLHPELAEPYGCGDMQFVPKPPTQEVLEEYKITEDEYEEICNELVKALSFGCCGLCV